MDTDEVIFPLGDANSYPSILKLATKLAMPDIIRKFTRDYRNTVKEMINKKHVHTIHAQICNAFCEPGTLSKG